MFRTQGPRGGGRCRLAQASSVAALFLAATLIPADGFAGGDDDFEFGDAPEGAIAYPSLGVPGRFPTCVAAGPAGFVRHAFAVTLRFGLSIDPEIDGNAGACLAPPYDLDECGGAGGDAGLTIPTPCTIAAGSQVVPCEPMTPRPLGAT